MNKTDEICFFSLFVILILRIVGLTDELCGKMELSLIFSKHFCKVRIPFSSVLENLLVVD